MKGNSITAIVDCNKQSNRAIARSPDDTIATDGIVLLGQAIEDNTFFSGVPKKSPVLPTLQIFLKMADFQL